MTPVDSSTASEGLSPGSPVMHTMNSLWQGLVSPGSPMRTLIPFIRTDIPDLLTSLATPPSVYFIFMCGPQNAVPWVLLMFIFGTVSHLSGTCQVGSQCEQREGGRGG